MTEEVQAEIPAAEVDNRTPMEKAVAGGYVAPAEASREDRAAAVVADLEHAMKHNGPVSPAVLAEVKDLLGVRDAHPDEGEEAEAHNEPAPEAVT